MRKLAKKILSICLIAIISIVNVAVFPVKAENDLIFDESIETKIDSEEITYNIYENEILRRVSYNKNGVEHVIDYNKQSGNLILDGKNIGNSEIGISLYASHELSRRNGTLNADLSDTAAVVAAIVAVVGSAGAAAAITIANVIVSCSLPTVYYTDITYYTDELVGGRPRMYHKYYFYSNAARTDLIGVI